jgi:hypothetical protein
MAAGCAGCSEMRGAYSPGASGTFHDMTEEQHDGPEADLRHSAEEMEQHLHELEDHIGEAVEKADEATHHDTVLGHEQTPVEVKHSWEPDRDGPRGSA